MFGWKQKMAKSKSKRKDAKPYKPQVNKVDAKLNQLAYTLKHNSLVVSDFDKVCSCFNHIWYLQEVSADSKYNWLGLNYLNSVKNSVLKLLNIMVEYDNYPANHPIKVHHMTRKKIMWFIFKFMVQLKPDMARITPSKNSKYKLQAQINCFMSVKIKNTNLAKYMITPF